MNIDKDKGFDVEFEVPKDQVQELLKKYKKVKKYQRSSLFVVKTMDGTENIVSKMIEEAQEEGF
jgi:phosphoribosyl-ATP pyrophosphohydrolase